MHMQIKGWTQFKSLVRWSVLYHHVVVLWLYMLLRSDAMLKEGVACGGIMLNSKQFVRSIQLLREDLWFFYMKRMDLYSHARIQLSIKLRKKLGLFTAELFPHGFLFTVPGVGKYENDRKQAETEEASTAWLQSKNRQNSFLLTACESVMKDS